MSQSEAGLMKKLKYSVISTIIIFIVGGILGFVFGSIFPSEITVGCFMTFGSYSIIVFWMGIITGRYLIKLGIRKNTVDM